jgi:hypothetical protein
MKPVYIIHPYRGKKGEYKANMAKIKDLCKRLSERLPGIIPISPVLAFDFLDDEDGEEREKAIGYCMDLLRVVGKAGGEAWYFGDWQNSKGCLREMETAKKLGIHLREGLEAK